MGTSGTWDCDGTVMHVHDTMDDIMHGVMHHHSTKRSCSFLAHAHIVLRQLQRGWQYLHQ